MTFEIVILAVANIVRPTSLAAVYALVSAPEPRRLMVVYVLAGMAATIAFGLMVIWVFGGIGLDARDEHTKGVIKIAGGLLILMLVAGVVTGRVQRRQTEAAGPGRLDRLRQRRITVPVAAVAGPFTHVPGLFYLLALNLIAASDAGVASGVLDVLVYNVIWYAIPLGALAICIVDPLRARRAVAAIDAWTKRHARGLLVGVSTVVGSSMILSGALQL
jgi:hypothetical protein